MIDYAGGVRLAHASRVSVPPKKPRLVLDPTTDVFGILEEFGIFEETN